MTTALDEQPDRSPTEIADDHDSRSLVVRRLILHADRQRLEDGGISAVPRVLVQFWDKADTIPTDVQACLDSWIPVVASGFERVVFDDMTAAAFINEHYSRSHTVAFERCTHPAMRADYFRLCFILKVGGFYIDADDEYQGRGLEHLVHGKLLKLQPLCYQAATDSMTDPIQAAGRASNGDRTFYVNNNPLIAPPNHPVVADALQRATAALLGPDTKSRDIQSITGPGNLTAALVAHAIERARSGGNQDFELLTDWDSVAISKWPLAYRSDDRNWRHWGRSGV